MKLRRLISNVFMLAALATIALASYFVIGTLDETDADSSIYLPVLTKAQVQANIKITKVIYTGDDEYVEVTNLGSQTEYIGAMRIRSLFIDQEYHFDNIGIPSGDLLPAQSLRLHFGPAAVSVSPYDIVVSTRNSWFDKGDVVQLFGSPGLVDVYCYGNFSDICK